MTTAISFPEIQRVAVLSTAHLSHETRELLEDYSTLPWMISGYDEGWFIWVPSDDLEEWLEHGFEIGFGEELLALIRQAHAQNIQFLRFDVDGPVVEGLPYTMEGMESE